LLDINKKINICNAPAGVGKSFLAIYAGLQLLKNGDIDKITVIVPTVEASEACKIGLLPGNISEKIEPYKQATISTIEKILKSCENIEYKAYTEYLLKNSFVEFDLLSYARGKNYDNTFLILDEAENLSKKECLLLLTRIGEGNSKIALIGDEQQCDRKDFKSTDNSGLLYAEEKLKGLSEVTVDKFSLDDIVRNSFLTKLLNAWG
jgi:phosphate starvation-inducible PhoH-like protein